MADVKKIANKTEKWYRNQKLAVQLLIVCIVGIVLGRMGFPWFW